MKIHFLGTNGWYCSPTGDTPCVLIDAKEAYVILDAGNGFQKLDTLLTDPKKPVYLFLSHFHLDHTYGFHTLPKFNLPQGLTIIGQEGTQKFLNILLNKPFSCPLDRLRTKVSITEVAEGHYNSPIPFDCAFLVHADPCLGYRLTLEGKVVTYLTDTGICDAMVPLARNADLLITECAWRVPNQIPGWPHLAPTESATVAKQADAKQLVLMHFDAYNYPTLADREVAQEKARTIFPKTLAATDATTLSL